MLPYSMNALGKKCSHYVQWNILLYWGLGLWLALCTSNMYHLDKITRGATLLYQKDWSFGKRTAHNIPMKVQTMESLPRIIVANCNSPNIVLNSRPVARYIEIVIFFCFLLIFLCVLEHIRKKIETLRLKLYDLYKTSSYSKNSRSCVLSRPFDKETSSEVIANREAIKEYSRKELSCELEENEQCAVKETENSNEFNNECLGINVVRDEIIFSNYISLLFNNYEPYRYSNYKQFGNICEKLLTKYSVHQNSEYFENRLESPKNYDDSSFSLKNGVIQKRIISSSPEFQRFLANLQRTRCFCPYMLEISTNYVIRIKSACK